MVTRTCAPRRLARAVVRRQARRPWFRYRLFPQRYILGYTGEAIRQVVAPR